MNHYQGARAVVIGGSIGGLTSALLLRDLGFEVDVFERTPSDLDGRGGGIVLQPDTLRWFRERSTQRPEDVSTTTRWVQYLGSDDEIVHRDERAWSHTSWGTFYRALLSDFGREHYHLGEFACGFDQTDDHVDVRFVSGRRERADLVVIADGVTSANRLRIDPDVTMEYSGYIGWRGTVDERVLSTRTADLLHDAITYDVIPHSQITMYPIPSARGTQVGDRLMNYVWYRNVAEGPDLTEMLTDKRGFVGKVSVHPGQVQDRYVDEMRETARRSLSPAAAEVVTATEEPFIQVVWDSRVNRMASGRVALIGDAACAARPHAAAGTAKAAADSWALADALTSAAGNIAEALEKWEPGQLELSSALLARVQSMGERSQFSNTWTPGDPDLRFGLYGPGR
ncbi:FAD-dependent monooxygenase [Rhodococcus sp. BP-316]|uniref:FAD binding domain-containing protein n=1 Tax=Rhodococcus sp. BP-316 TaxID=2739445 RepID=UPI001C9AA4D1|nr:FAD binding domain-containing protein [Rhodococcus sp. BP-316]MBY6683417.1 FAD-dependent monooxygenase [Rhodococcus sp. BP-316]